MKIFLTGASGFLGKRLLENLMRQDGLLLKVLQYKKVIACKNCEIVKGDLNDPKTFLASMNGVDLIVHIAALTHSDEEDSYFRVNALGTKNLLDAAKRMGVKRFVYVSSFSAHPQGGAYATSKLEGEKYVKQSTLSWVIIRPSEIYGKDSSDVINKLIQWIKSFRVVPILGKGHYCLSPVSILDLIPAMIRIIFDENFCNITFALTGPEVIEYPELIDRIGHFVQVYPIHLHIPLCLGKLLIRLVQLFKKDFLSLDQIPRLLCDKQTYNRSSVKLTGFCPKKLEEGLAKVLN